MRMGLPRLFLISVKNKWRAYKSIMNHEPMGINIEPEHTDFIGIYRGAVNPDFCDYLINYMNEAQQVIPRNYTHVKDKQICLDAFSPGEARDLMGFVNQCLGVYINQYPYLTNFNYVSSVCLMQHTKPTEGYHLFHGENINWNLNTRTMAWMGYLNDVEDGGETEFLYQGLKIKPTKGTVVIWPGSYTHLHRGNPPMSDKYIATGWYQGSIGLSQVQTAGLNDKQYMDSMDA